jgi:hypothetical protein
MAQRRDPIEVWWLELERERLDTSWRKTENPIGEQALASFITKKDVEDAFHCGRYHQGARDPRAVVAYNKSKRRKS